MKKSVFIIAGVLVLVPAAAITYAARPLDSVREFGLEVPEDPEPSAYHLLLQAAGHFQEKPVDALLDPAQSSSGPEKEYPAAARLAWVQANKRGFELLDGAMRAQYFYPLRETPKTAESNKLQFRKLARYLVVRGNALAESGRAEPAVDAAVQTFDLAIKLTRGGDMTQALNGAVCEVYARQLLTGEIAHLNGVQAARAARHLEAVLEQRSSPVQILRQERLSTLFHFAEHIRQNEEEAAREAHVAQVFKEALQRGDVPSYDFNQPLPQPNPVVRGLLAPWRAINLRLAARRYARATEHLISLTEKPWPQRPHEAAVTRGQDAVTSKLLVALHRARFPLTRTSTAAQLQLARLGLHAYRKDTGQYPPNLEALVPRYLRKVPQDGFSGGPLRYRRDGKRYKVWSVGPDGRDDNGRPFENSQAYSPKLRYLVREDSTGDMVGNVND